jgi:ADP-ribose pyrophosphatase YjhB (NUDIX family)
MKGPRLIVRALIVEAGRLLVNQRPGRLALFGGRVEKGETARQALFRELQEELGLEVEVGALAFLIENFYRDERERRIHELGLYYRVERRTTEAIAPRERDLSPMWLSLDELPQVELRPRVLQKELARGFPPAPLSLVEIDRSAFPEML